KKTAERGRSLNFCWLNFSKRTQFNFRNFYSFCWTQTPKACVIVLKPTSLLTIYYRKLQPILKRVSTQVYSFRHFVIAVSLHLPCLMNFHLANFQPECFQRSQMTKLH